MLRNTVATTLTFFYPFGNTPAIRLTQDLPVDQDANLLLLGCGDVRNILFTNHAKFGSQQFDFTCCDIEPAIIARNILFLSLIIDDLNNQNSDILWQIYYHIRISPASVALLESQAVKLLEHSQSLSTWHNGPYGRTLRFCDSQTLTNVKAVWSEYTAGAKTSDLIEKRKSAFENTLKVAENVRSTFFGEEGIQLSALRSAAPASISGMHDLPALAQEYWSKGYLQTNNRFLDANQLNPALLSGGSSKPVLHYGSDPLLGFHLAGAYIPFEDPQPVPPEELKSKLKVVDVAQAELRAWSASFRDAVKCKSIIVRCFSGDALAFAYALQSLNNSSTMSSGFYVDAWTFTQLSLDGEDYNHSSGSAPLSYNIIDTSNLADHLGTLNMLIATVPLLHSSPSSTIYTEILVQHEASVKSMLDGILCGDFTTMSLLLGLAVVGTWTNAASSSDEMDQTLFNTLAKLPGTKQQDSRGKQMRTHLPWKLSTMHRQSGLRFSPEALANLLRAAYKSMFGHEDPAMLMASLNISGTDKASNPYYNRASFVAFLYLTKSHIKTDWSKTFAVLLRLIEHDNSLAISRNFLQELVTYLCITGLHTVDVLHQTPEQVFNKKLSGRLASWSSLPNTVAITIEVPIEHLKFFTDMKLGQAGTPSFCCSLQSSSGASSQWLNQFSVIQSGFGSIMTERLENTNEPIIKVNEDEMKWGGTSHLIVSFYTPTWILLQEEGSACVAVGFQSTAHAIMTYVKHLGPNLQFFKTQISDSKVHISRHMPSQRGSPIIGPSIHEEESEPVSSPYVARSTLSADYNSAKGTVDSLTAKIEVKNAAQERLGDKSTEVYTKQKSGTEIEVFIGNKISYIQSFPRPVSAARNKIRIARKSAYIEIVAPFLSPLQQDKVDTFVFPMTFASSKIGEFKCPTALNTHTVNLDICPSINTNEPNKLGWATTHLSAMFSGREREQREQGEQGLNITSPKDTRVDFKDGLFSIFMHSTGVQGRKTRIFGLHKKAGGVDTLIFVSKVRLDLNDRVILLDAAVIPLQHSIMKDPLVQDVLGKMQSTSPPLLAIINVDESEMQVWKSIFPALAERCRTWKHKAKSCEYNKHETIPVPGGLSPASTPLCSCGLGQIPKDFMKGTKADIPRLDQVLRKYATRIAISPVFHVPYVESGIDLNTFTPVLRRDGVPAELSNTTIDGCAMCGKQEALASSSTSSGLLKCARCKAVRYCSKECQKRHWQTHKIVCK